MSDSEELDDFELQVAAARVIYEGTHGMTMNMLAKETGIEVKVLKSTARSEGWRKRHETKNGTIPEVAALAEQLKKRPIGGAPVSPPDNSHALVSEVLPSEASEVEARHKQELMIARTLVAESLKLRDTNPSRAFDRAKLAKITSESLNIIHTGERKLFGLDRDKAPGVEINRE